MKYTIDEARNLIIKDEFDMDELTDPDDEQYEPDYKGYKIIREMPFEDNGIQKYYFEIVTLFHHNLPLRREYIFEDLEFLSIGEGYKVVTIGSTEIIDLSGYRKEKAIREGNE
jgi:hypothetical protein